MPAPITDERLAEIRAWFDTTDEMYDDAKSFGIAHELIAEVDRLRVDRAALLRWLRWGAETGNAFDPLVMGDIADDVERGEHLSDYINGLP